MSSKCPRPSISDSAVKLFHSVLTQSEVEATLQRINLHKVSERKSKSAACGREGGCCLTLLTRPQGVHATIIVNAEGQPVRTNAEVRCSIGSGVHSLSAGPLDAVQQLRLSPSVQSD